MQDLILLHGALGCKSDFNELKSVLGSEYIVHTIDFNGHGGKEFTSDTFSLSGFSDDVLQYMSENNINNALFFGYSMGGYIALYLALTHPDKVKSIFTLGTKFDWNIESSIKEAGFLNHETVILKVPAFAEELSNKHSADSWVKMMQLTRSFILELGNKHLIESDFNQINCPVKICVGDSDKMVDVPSSLMVSQQLKLGSFVVLAETGHLLKKVNLNRLTFEISEYFRN